MVMCPPTCDNHDYGNCPTCYEATGLGCPHGEVCEDCRADTQRGMTLGDIYPYDCDECEAPCAEGLCPTCADASPEWTDADETQDHMELLGDVEREERTR